MSSPFTAILVLLAMTGVASAATARREPFGETGGARVEAVVLEARGVRARVIGYGASIQSVEVAGRDGRVADVALGYATLAEYVAQPQYFGSTVGRVANRIAGGRFTLDGVAYRVPVNNGPNSLHGGTAGFDKRVWRLVEARSGATARAVFELVSADGDQGYPGTLAVRAAYTLSDAGELGVAYSATTDRTTVVALSNHAYWNLAGEGAPGGAMGHRLTILGEAFTPVDATLIPTGEVRPVAGTVFDFRSPTPVGARVRDADAQIATGRGYDHNWVVGRGVSADVRLVARVEDPGSGRVLEVLSDQPGLQFYSGNFLDGTVRGKSGRFYRQGDCVVLEPQMFPDTVNRPAFGSVRLEPGRTYRNRIVFRFPAVAR